MMISPFFLAGPMEIVMIMMMGGGGGLLPMGIPPLPEDPVISQVAPEECLFYVNWSGMAEPDADSTNRTERLLAEEEVRHFVGQLRTRILASIRAQVQDEPGGEAMVDDISTAVLTVLTRPTAIFLGKVSITPLGTTVEGGAIVNLGERADEIERILGRLEVIALDNRTEADGSGWRSIPMPPDAPPIQWGVKDGYLIVGVGKGSADAIVGRMNNVPPSWLTAARRQIPMERPGNFLYVNTGQIMRQFGPLGGEEVTNVLKALGVDNVESIVSVTGLEGDACVTKTLVAVDGQLKGILSLAGAEALTAEDLAVIPRDVTIAAAVRFDLAKGFSELLDIVGNIEPQGRTEMLEGLSLIRQEAGFDLRADVFDAVGDVWRVYNSPGEGGLVITGLTAVTSLRNRERLVAANAKLVELVAQENAAMFDEDTPRYQRRGVTIRDFSFADEKVFFLNIVGETVPFAPAWCITDDELIVALFPQNVKSYLLRKARGQADDSLVGVPEVARVLASGSTIGLSYQNSPEMFEWGYPLLQIFTQFMCGQMQQQGVKIDISILPSAPSIARHLRPGFSTVSRTDAGILLESRQTVPVSAGALTLPMMGFFFVGWSMARDFGPPDVYEEEWATESVPEFETRQLRSIDNLKMIALAMHNYHEAHKRFPPAASVSDDGKPLLSWRVAILPFLEEDALYEQFHLDEPWDSEHNRPLVQRMPTIYDAPKSTVSGGGRTNYLGVAGASGIFADAKGTRMAQIRDGLSNTVMVVEAADTQAVPWTKPGDFDYGGTNPIARLVDLQNGRFLAAFADGSVRYLDESIGAKTLKALCTRDGGEVIGRDAMDGSGHDHGADSADESPRYRSAPAKASDLRYERPRPIRRPPSVPKTLESTRGERLPTR